MNAQIPTKPVAPEYLKNLLGLEGSSFWRFIHDEEIPFTRFTAKQIRFDPEAVKKALEIKEQRTVRCHADLARLVSGRQLAKNTAALLAQAKRGAH